MLRPESLRRLVLVGAVASALSWIVPARIVAQDTIPSTRVPNATAEDSSRWQFSFTPYVWPAGQKGRAGVGGSVAEVDLSVGDIIDQVDLGFTSLLEARHARLIGRVDFQYVSLADDVAVPLSSGANGTVAVSLDQVIAQPELGYTLVVQPWGGLDGLVGVRYWHLSTDIGAIVGGTQIAAVSGSKDWVDGTVGARLRFSPSAKWCLFAKGDLGGGGAKFSWQALGGVGYSVGHCCTALAAYRHLDVDYESDEFVNDFYMTGPALGFELRF